MPLNPIRCDECIRRHKKCDRRLPSCQTCIQRGDKCKYGTKAKCIRKFDQINVKIMQYKENKNKVMVKRKIRASKPYEIQWRLHNLNPSNNKHSILKLPNGYGSDSSPLAIMHRFPKKTILENLMTIVQYPSPFKLSNGLSLFLMLTEKLKIFVYKQNSSNTMTILPKSKVLIIKEIFQEAINNYFTYINSIFPLFIEKDFNFFSKPLLLRIVILGSGLLWCKQNEIIDDLVSHLSEQIWEMVKHPHHLKPSLETIQSLLIFITGFKLKPKFTQLFADSLTYCNRVSIALGLSFTPRSVKNTKVLERILTCSCLNYMNQYGNLTCGTNVHPPTKIELLSKKYKSLLLNYHAFEKIDKPNSLDSKVIICSFYCDISMVYFALRMLKSRFIFSTVPFTELENVVLSILNKIEQIEYNYLNICIKLKNNSKIPKTLSDYLVINCYYLKYFLYTLYLYHPLYSTSQEAPQTNQKLKSIINKALNCCSLIINVSVNLPPQYMILMGLPSLSQCIIFMIRYKQYSPKELDNIIELGKQYLKRLSQISSFKFLYKYNMYFIDMIEKNIQKKAMECA